jgi:uncharacterized protein YfaT (DUF1175 family)
MLAALLLSVGVAAAHAAPGAPPPRGDSRSTRAVDGARAPEALLRQIVAETALAQLEAMDPRWPEAQRDCAGLVRFAYRTAFKRLEPARAAAGPFRDATGAAAHFADAATLLAASFVPLGRDGAARERLRSGDLLAFARVDEDGAPVHHLMLVVRPDDPARGRALVVYHPGEQGAAVRSGFLDDLQRDAPHGWRPVPENPLFLGFYRLKEFAP